MTALAALLALCACLAPAGCGRRRSHQAVLRDLLCAAEETAAILAEAKTVADLNAHESRLRELAGQVKRLRKETRSLGRAPDADLARYGPRITAALNRIADIQVAWSKEDRRDMLEYVDGLKAD